MLLYVDMYNDINIIYGGIMIDYLNKLGFDTLTDIQSEIIKQPIKQNVLVLGRCGSGKTEGAYTWGLNNNTKLILAEPRKTLANDICNRLNQYNNILQLDRWYLQHSSVVEDKFLNNKFCVTTIDQILSGYLGIGTQSFIKGKNVMTSDIIFDEVQLFDIDKTLLTTINMLDMIYQYNQHNFMIMTATMPTYLIDFLSERYNMKVIISNTEQDNKRVKIHYLKTLDYDNINNYTQKQIIICNSQKEQEEIGNNIIDKNRIVYLNNYLLPTDRNIVEQEVIQYFGKKSFENNKILITTQIVEAGMDISASRVYSSNAPIDCIIQRLGRCVRWGGDGDFYIFEYKNYVYNNKVVQATNDIIYQHDGEYITWEMQKKWCNDILNPFYQEYINKINIKRNRVNLLTNRRDKLIRDVRSVNIIIQDINNGVALDMFNREGVSIDILKLKHMTNNTFYKLKNKNIELAECKDIDIGDTLIISNNDCIYDKLGFRIKEGSVCIPFQYIVDNNKNNQEYRPYIEEEWISHATLTRKCLVKNLKQYRYFDYIDKNFEYICEIGGLHDVGKTDVEWINWTGSQDKILAHFPFTHKVFKCKDRKHNYISAYILKEYIDNILFNVILQHHKRIVTTDNNLYITEYHLCSTIQELLNTYGFNEIINNNEKDIVIEGNKVFTPIDKEWGIFLIIVGTLMQSDIEAINTYLDLHEINNYNIK